MESLYVDDERFKGKGLSILLLTKAFWLGKFDGLVPVDTNENPGYWEAATAKNIVPIRHPITNSEMRAQIKAVLSAAEGRWRNIMAFPSNGRAIEA